MSGFSTERLEPTSRGAPVSSQPEPREFPGKRRLRPQPKPQAAADREATMPESSDEPRHQLDDLA